MGVIPPPVTACCIYSLLFTLIQALAFARVTPASGAQIQDFTFRPPFAAGAGAGVPEGLATSPRRALGHADARSPAYGVAVVAKAGPPMGAVSRKGRWEGRSKRRGVDVCMCVRMCAYVCVCVCMCA